jgi:hypothetical protein
MAAQRGFEIVHEYTDRISGAKARRPGLDELMRDARHGRFDVVLVWASDRIARSVKHFLDVLDELNRMNIEFVSFREQIDTGGPLGRAVVVIIGAIAELERNLIIERVRAGMRRARLEGRHIGRKPLALDHAAILRGRQQGFEPRSASQGAPGFPSNNPSRTPRTHPGDRGMNEGNSYILLYMLLFLSFGFVMGLGFGEQTGRRRGAEQLVQELRDRLKSPADLASQLKQLRGVLNDVHKKISAVSKSLEKRPS